MSDVSEAFMVVGVIEIQRVIMQDGSDQVFFKAVDGGGEGLPLVMTLGMLELSKDTAIREAMGTDSDD